MAISSYILLCSVFQNLPVTKITEQLMECRTGGDLDDYLYLDPKLLKGGDIVPKNRAPFQDAVVFIVGGGNYIEYQNLVDFIKVSGRKGMIPSGFTWNSNRANSSFFSKNNRRIQPKELFTVLQLLIMPSNSCAS